jgi:hypothetical protein
LKAAAPSRAEGRGDRHLSIVLYELWYGIARSVPAAL